MTDRRYFILPLISVGLIAISMCAFIFTTMSMTGNTIALGIGAVGVVLLGYSTVRFVHDPSSLSKRRLRVSGETRSLWRRFGGSGQN